jgi:nitrate/nitrite transport system ATP-binding protein
VNNPNYYRMRGEMVEFLDRQKRLKAERAKKKSMAVVSIGSLEKVNLSLGFIPLTDCAPLVVAQEKGLFQKYGLDVTLSRENSWNSIAEGIREGRLDAAQMVTGMPLALTLGMDNKPPMAVKTALTISRQLYEAGVSDLAGLKEYLCNYPQQNPEDHDLPAMAMVHRASMHNLLLRHWLASAQVEPDRQVEVLVVPPAQMISNLMADNIIGYCVGEPWNYRAVHDNLGVVVATGKDIWSAHPEKVLGVRQEWAQQYPHSYLALVKALLEACQYCESTENREELLAILSRPEYLNLDPMYIRTGFAGPYRKGTGDSLFMQDFFLFAQDNAPRRHEHLWVLTQMARWGLLKFPSNYTEVLDQVVDWETYDAALMELELPMTMDNPDQITFADGTVFDLADPITALQSMPYSRFEAAVPFELTSNLEKKAVTI